jgi:hypothetical protein
VDACFLRNKPRSSRAPFDYGINLSVSFAELFEQSQQAISKL